MSNKKYIITEDNLIRLCEDVTALSVVKQCLQNAESKDMLHGDAFDIFVDTVKNKYNFLD